ncbi:hypothetical protein HOL24_04480 [bacterium]|jgi:phosphosulfolactate synthase|nr:hypothetical protein [bacterium]
MSCKKPFIDLPNRTNKPRNNGLTNLVDNGWGLMQLEDVLRYGSNFVDIVKLGWASAYISDSLDKKIELIHSYNARVCLGGMMFEILYIKNKYTEYADWLNDLGIKLVEISNGSLPIKEIDKLRMVEYFASRGFTVLSEVGSKDVTCQSSPEEWARAVSDDLDAGAWKVILEGRADASAGIYREDGSLQDDIIQAVLNSGINAKDIIFEAPHKRQMTWFVEQFGANVNLGNIPPDEIINLETLRLGLRGDTAEHFHVL